MRQGIDIFPIHGISKEINAETYYNDFANGVRKFLPIDFDLRFHPIDHSRLLKSKEEIIYSWFKGDWYPGTRKWTSNYICDILALAPTETMMPGNFYWDVLDMIAETYDAVCKSYPNSKKVIFGHSLGAEIGLIFSFKREVDYMFTCGSPINWFAIRYPDFGRFPEATLHNWLNFHYVQDVVSGRITRNPNFQKRQNVKDIVLPLWNPLHWRPSVAHTFYWKDERMHKKISEELIKIAGVK